MIYIIGDFIIRTLFYFTGVIILLLAAAMLISGCTAEYKIEVVAEPEYAGEVTGGGVYTVSKSPLPDDQASL